MLCLPNLTKRASSRRQIDIKEIEDGILELPGGRYRAILQVSSVNYELKSEQEQDALIDIYESFLNSVGCSLQFLVHIRELDVDKYLLELEEKFSPEPEAVYISLTRGYLDFLGELVKDNKILTRCFYVVVPYESKGGKNAGSHKEQIYLRCDIVSKGLDHLGISAKRLNSLEVLDLFYSSYNPTQAKIQPITIDLLKTLYADYVRGKI